MKKNKNIIVTICIITGLLLFFILSFMISDNNVIEVEVNLPVDEWISETHKDQYVVTVIGSTSCPHCQQYKPVIAKLSKSYDFKMYFYESDVMEEEEYNKIMDEYEGLEHEYIPFTIITKNGKVITTESGFNNKKELKKFLEKNGVI